MCLAPTILLASCAEGAGVLVIDFLVEQAGAIVINRFIDNVLQQDNSIKPVEQIANTLGSPSHLQQEIAGDFTTITFHEISSDKWEVYRINDKEYYLEGFSGNLWHVPNTNNYRYDYKQGTVEEIKFSKKGSATTPSVISTVANTNPVSPKMSARLPAVLAPSNAYTAWNNNDPNGLNAGIICPNDWQHTTPDTFEVRCTSSNNQFWFSLYRLPNAPTNRLDSVTNYWRNELPRRIAGQQDCGLYANLFFAEQVWNGICFGSNDASVGTYVTLTKNHVVYALVDGTKTIEGGASYDEIYNHTFEMMNNSLRLF
jgi:hypothetical protein